VDYPNENIPAGPPLVTTKEPVEKDIDEDKIVFTYSAWCHVVLNAPASETTSTHIPVKGDDIEQKLDHDENLAHKENSKEESASPHDKNENCSSDDDDSVPASFSAHSRLWGIMVWMMTVDYISSMGLHSCHNGTWNENDRRHYQANK
jgi:hypothetical protein